MQTEALIAKLSSGLKPVRRLNPPEWRLLAWLGMSLVYVGLGIAFFGLRSDFEARTRDARFLLDSAALLLLSMASAATTFFLSVPGRREAHWTTRAMKMTAGAWGLYFAASFALEWRGGNPALLHAGTGYLCVESILELGLIPAISIFWMIRRAAPLELGRVGAFAMLAATGLAGFATQLLCEREFPLHFIVWHLMPVGVLAALGVFLGRRFLKSRERV